MNRFWSDWKIFYFDKQWVHADLVHNLLYQWYAYWESVPVLQITDIYWLSVATTEYYILGAAG